jgi:hypothetical protein
VSEPLHFSALKQIGKSAKAFKWALEHPKPPTDAMLLGTAVDALVFGTAPIVVFPGKVRSGKAWDEFKLANGSSLILTTTLADKAHAMAEAIATDEKVADSGALVGQVQLPMQWERDGVKCETRGIDIIGAEWITELKTCYTAEPDRFARQALAMGYHAQLVWYRDGARKVYGPENGKRLYIVCVESSPPYDVTVMELTKEAIVEGEKLISSWMERYRACAAVDQWPGYTQTVIPLDAAATLYGFEGEGEDDNGEGD